MHIYHDFYGNLLEKVKQSDLFKFNKSSCTLTAVVLLLSAWGCSAPTQEVKKQRYFWPPLPDEPRIEWIARYSSQHDFPKTSGQRFMESLVGREPAKTLKKPWGVASDGEGMVYVADTQGSAVTVYDMNRNVVYDLGQGQYEDLFKRPIDVDVDASGNIYVSDSMKKRVYAFTKDQKPLMTIGSDEIFQWPSGIGIDKKRNRLYVTDSHLNNVSVFDTVTGQHLFSFGKRGTGDGEMNFPSDVAVDSKGNIYVSDTMNARIESFDPEGKFILKFGRRGDGPTDFKLIKGISISRDDYVLLTDAMANRIMVFSKEGEALLTLGVRSAGGAIGGFNIPQGIYVDKNERVFVVNALNKNFEVFQILNKEWLLKNPIEK